MPAHTRCPPPKRITVQHVDAHGTAVGPARDYRAPHPKARAKRTAPRERRAFEMPVRDAPGRVGEPDAGREGEVAPRPKRPRKSKKRKFSEEVPIVAAHVGYEGTLPRPLPPHQRRKFEEIMDRRIDAYMTSQGMKGLDGDANPIAVHGKRKATKANRKRIARLVMKRLVDVNGPAPRYEDIDPWAVDFLPCSGETYEQFRSGVTRSDAYWNRAAGREHGPSKRKVNTEHAQVKRELWHKALYDCALGYWKWKNGVPFNARDVDPREFLDGLGSMRKGKKSMAKKASKKERCKGAPKKISRGCSEAAFKKNMRHLVCQGKRPQQAAAIAFALVYKGCGVKQTKRRRKVAAIVAAGKRKKTRAPAPKRRAQSTPKTAPQSVETQMRAALGKYGFKFGKVFCYRDQRSCRGAARKGRCRIRVTAFRRGTRGIEFALFPTEDFITGSVAKAVAATKCGRR